LELAARELARHLVMALLDALFLIDVKRWVRASSLSVKRPNALKAPVASQSGFAAHIAVLNIGAS
jgi:hypothetical protein